MPQSTPRSDAQSTGQVGQRYAEEISAVFGDRDRAQRLMMLLPTLWSSIAEYFRINP
jgi:hypothetical protein